MTDNISVAVKGHKLTIEVDLSKTYGKSSSGKTTIVASTQGNMPLDGTDGVVLGLNLYRKP